MKDSILRDCPTVNEIVIEAVAISLNAVIPDVLEQGAQMHSCYEHLLILGYTSETPTKPGIYWMVCDENDYEPELVKVDKYPITGDLVVHCPETGIWPIEHYNLTNLTWKRFSPGANL